jgi:CBS domain-containing protein
MSPTILLNSKGGLEIQMVKEIMTTNPVRVEASQTVREAVKIMTEKTIGSIFVYKKGEIVGILEEGDILKKVLCKDLNPYVTKVEEVMSPLHTINEDKMDDEAGQMMIERGVRHITVSENSKVVGVISMFDLMRPIYTRKSFGT